MRILGLLYSLALFVVLASGLVYSIATPVTWQLVDTAMAKMSIVSVVPDSAQMATTGDRTSAKHKFSQARADRNYPMFFLVVALTVFCLYLVVSRRRAREPLFKADRAGIQKLLLVTGASLAAIGHGLMLLVLFALVLWLPQIQIGGGGKHLLLPMFLAFLLYVVSVFCVEATVFIARRRQVP